MLSILQEDDIDFDRVPEGVAESLDSYLATIAQRNYFDYTTMIATAVAILESAEDDGDPATRAVLAYTQRLAALGWFRRSS